MTRTFKLSDDFVDSYRSKTPPWGFADEAGNSLGEITFLRSYSRLKPDGSKETWADACRRVTEGTFSVQREHCRRNQLPWDSRKAQHTARDFFDRMFHFKWLPPGRGIANMGASFVQDEWDGTPLQSCAFISTYSDYPEAMHFLMLASTNGVGVGFDVLGESRHLVRGTIGEPYEHVIPDTREGWAEALQELLEAHLNSKPQPVFDYSLIRPAGAPIARFGGTASGPESLKDLLDWLQTLLENRKGSTLTATDITDIANRIGVCVVSGSSRRSAEIALGPATEEYLDLKNYEVNPHRAEWGWTSNNSIYAEIGMDYTEVARRTATNGEPGYVWMETIRSHGRLKDGIDTRDHRAAGVNPCSEQPLEPWEACTLVETFPTRAESIEDYLKTLKVAYLYAKTVTLLPTVFPRTNAVMARNRRIGLSQTGITTYVDQHGISNWRALCDAGYAEVQRLDTVYSDWLCVRESIRTTTVKPSGTVSLLTGDSPGVHWNPAANYYIRRITIADGVLLDAIREAGYEVEASASLDSSQYVVSFPVKSPFRRSDSEVGIWEKAAIAAEAQHVWSDNAVSVTISFTEAEKKDIPRILSLYEGKLKAVSFLPQSTDVYPQMPYDPITEERYQEMVAKLKPITGDIYLTGVDALGEKFCTTDKCEIPG